jgi:GNAT superfamily N-acetyltransferase
MTQPAVPDSPDWQRRRTIDAGSVSLQPVTRRIAQAVLDGGPITCKFESGALHDRIPQAMGVAILHIDSGAAAVLPTVWLVTRRADGQILGDIGTHGPPDSEGCVEIGYSLAPSARGKGIGTAAVAALVGHLTAVPRIRRLTAVTSAQNAASRRLLERRGIPHHGSASRHRRGALHPDPELAGHLIAIAPQTSLSPLQGSLVGRSAASPAIPVSRRRRRARSWTAALDQLTDRDCDGLHHASSRRCGRYLRAVPPICSAPALAWLVCGRAQIRLFWRLLAPRICQVESPSRRPG